jgi:hypothetical protein
MLQKADLARRIPRIENRRQAIDFFSDGLGYSLGHADGSRTDEEIKRRSDDGLVREVMVLEAGCQAQMIERQQRRQLQKRTSVHVTNRDRARLSLSRDVDARHAHA